MNTVQLNAPDAVRDIASRLEHSGFETWAVGGAVRDSLLGLKGSDWDLATRARPRDVQKVFKRTVPVGIDHGTVGVLAKDGVMYEVTTFRLDVETFGRHATVKFADTIEEDLARRDFTFNAIAWNPITQELRDPYNGFEDLRAARLQTVGDPKERFAEDYLRILRALRFAGHFVLNIEGGTWSALTSKVAQLDILSAERIREELWKVFTKTRHASAALKLYAESGVLRQLYPEVDKVVELDDKTVWTNTLAAVDAISIKRPAVRMAAFLHAIGMPIARVKDLRGEYRYTGHEVHGGRLAENLMKRLKASNADTDRVTNLVAWQNDFFPPDAPDAGIRRWLKHVPPDYVRDLFRLRMALHRADDIKVRWLKAHKVLLDNPVLETSQLALSGRDLKALGYKPGPDFGKIMDELLQRVIDDPALNDRDKLSAIVQETWPV
ncbi:MAG TPA: CCA tRNA nucleotidyltransferase [Longimicrobiales bacterium]|nr:CCA tRNA nucleotidyltransferase [Longimicrobiales bacterium]